MQLCAHWDDRMRIARNILGWRMIKRNTVILFGLSLLLAACEQASRVGGSPFLTTNPANLPRADAQEYISICYNADTTTRQSIEALAMESCKKDVGGTIKFFRHDMIFNDCPVVTKARATFLCLPRRK